MVLKCIEHMKKEIRYYMYHDGLLIPTKTSQSVEIAEPLINDLLIQVCWKL